jgi:transcriptional regulator with XRE-family HTH domain
MPARHGGADRVSTKAKLADEMVVLGRVLVRARERAGLRQVEVSTALGLPASWLSKVENGTRRLDVVEFVKICEAMRADPSAVMAELRDALADPGEAR